ncbi:MBL fold metallo-hydrolase [Shewanella surugensis]|uniref:MBL fold metallo-hydrolase n=1 Tax=Shewanella surugensis TaxID=212020 RepID=A0ABT0LFH6_9GAMM|nr:MBL fold metallo-hydrolase [Shewanella surugensis]MCL1126451.1 MBL fold metallo-hydrolase [Shewanella surugensis]
MGVFCIQKIMKRAFAVFFKLVISVIVASAFSPVIQANDDKFKDVEIISIALNDTSYMLMGAGGNIGVSAGPDGILIIDDQFAPLADKISQALNTLQPGVPKFIINTHFHRDHTGGNGYFGKNGIIMAHKNVLTRLSSNTELPKSALPVITYNDGLEVHFNNDTLNVMHMGPGHTDGDSIVWWKKSNIVHMGDLFFKDRFPYIDLEHGGSVTGYRNNVAKILTQINAQTKIIPGHGSLSTKVDLIRFKAMLDDSILWMQTQLANNKSLDMIKKQGFPTQWKQWGLFFISEDKWIETLYQGLSPRSQPSDEMKQSNADEVSEVNELNE